MEIFFTPEAWLSLLTLTLMEIVLGVDNILFISIVSNSLPEDRQRPAQRIGLVVAMFFRVALLILLVWLIQEMTAPLFYVAEMGFSFRELVLAAGGLFLVAKSVSEIHGKMEMKQENSKKNIGNQFLKVVVQIVLLNIVFSFDSILTAIGLSNQILVMIAAVFLSMFVMIVFASAISKFISKHPTLEILALSFLILIGFMLILEGVHIEVPKGYIYFAVFFSLVVEIINMKMRRKSQQKES
jgi:predicted tellurium resistance membrane protein TerC